MDLNKACLELPRFKKLLETNTKEAFEPHNFNRGMEAAATIFKCFRVLAHPDSQKALYELNKHMALTLNSFYNETASFILDNKPRKSGLNFYLSLLEAYLDEIKASKTPRTSESLGGSILASMIGVRSIVRSRGDRHQAIDLDDRLLSYADHELFALYVTRKAGVIDMIDTLSIFLKIAHPL